MPQVRNKYTATAVQRRSGELTRTLLARTILRIPSHDIPSHHFQKLVSHVIFRWIRHRAWSNLRHRPLGRNLQFTVRLQMLRKLQQRTTKLGVSRGTDCGSRSVGSSFRSRSRSSGGTDQSVKVRVSVKRKCCLTLSVQNIGADAEWFTYSETS